MSSSSPKSLLLSSNSVDDKGADVLGTGKFMETEFCCGSLSKKIDLDAGGAPHSNRSWTTYFAAIKGSNLSFYKNKEKVSPSAVKRPNIPTPHLPFLA